MRVLPPLMLAVAQLCAAAPPSESEAIRAFQERVAADLRRPFPTDAELTKRLADHRQDFDQLIAMVKTDKELVRIAPDFTWTTTSSAWPRPASELGFTTQRWDEYRRLFQTLGLEAGVLRRSDLSDTIYLFAQTKGLIIGGCIKGYAYSDATLDPRCESLDKPEAIPEDKSCYKALGGEWYLYLQRED